MGMIQPVVADEMRQHPVSDVQCTPASQSIENNSAAVSLTKAEAIKAMDARAFTAICRNEFSKNHQNIPAELRPLSAWLVWKCPEFNKKTGKVKKVPVYATNGKNRSGKQGTPDDIANLVTFDQAFSYVASHTNVAGIGFCTLPQFGITALDVDHCVTDGVVRENVEPLIGDTYAEFSPSGTGVRAFYIGAARDGKNNATGYEVFAEKGFVTVTGEAIYPDQPLPLQRIDEPLRLTLEKLLKTSPPVPDDDTEDESVDDTEQPPMPVTGHVLDSLIADLRSALVAIPSDDRDLWQRIGHALKTIGDQGWALFDEWSAKSDKYDPADTRRVWESFKPTQTNYKAIFVEAQRRGWVNPASKGAVKELNPLWSLAQRLEMEEGELAEAIEYKPEVVRNIVTSCAFSQTSGKFLVMERSGDLRTFHKGDLAVGFAGTFGRTHDGEKLATVASDYADNQMLSGPEKKDFISSCASSIFNQMQRHILVKRQYSDLQIIVDMFATESSVLLHDGQATITYPHGAFPTGPIDSVVVADYKQHWAMFDEFLDLVVAARFARSRKKAFLWIMTQSDWGKSFLLSLFSNLGLVIEMSTQEVERAFSGQPIGQTVRNFKRAWIMAVEEFKSVKSELKQLEQKMLFSPKGLPTVTAPLYLKLFLSAERVESLASDESGVEDQFANRFSILEPEGGRLSERPLFQQGRGRYIDSLTNYVADYLNRKVSEYRALGEIGASNRGDSIVEAFHQAHGAGQKFERLSTKIPQLAEQFQEWILSNYRSAKNAQASFHERRLSSNEQAVLESALIKDELGKVLYIKRAAKLLEQWLNDTFNQSERGKLIFKRVDILAQLPQSKTIYLEYERHKAMRIGYIDNRPDFDPADAGDYRKENAEPD